MFVLDPEMSLDVKTISVQDISLILGHTLHYRMEPSLFATLLPYMNSVLSSALSKISIFTCSTFSMKKITERLHKGLGNFLVGSF